MMKNGIKKIGVLFRLRREERMPAAVALVLIVGLNALMIWHYYGDFTPLHDNYWNLFIGKFRVSGFDPITYYVVSNWEARYNVYRHPLLAFFMWVPYVVNQGLIGLTGMNCVQFVVAAILVFCAFYAFIFMYRIGRDIVQLGRADALIGAFLLYSFAYVMLSSMVPDHFIISMFLLLLLLYVAGRRLITGRDMPVWQTVTFFTLIGGVSLNNGLKVFLASLFTNRRRFFRIRHLVWAVLIPSLLMWGFSKYEYRQFVWAGEQARHAAKAKRKAAQQEREKQLIIQQKAAGDTAKTVSQTPKKKRRPVQGTPISNGEFMRWTDISSSRTDALVHNLFGESIQLHRDYLLMDTFRTRPMVVKYRSFVPYVVEFIVVLLFFLGVWCGRKSRFLWLVMSFFGADMLLHVGLGFGINEVYIMSAHWIYAIPIGISYLLKASRSRLLRALLMLTICWLYARNLFLIVSYMV